MKKKFWIITTKMRIDLYTEGNITLPYKELNLKNLKLLIKNACKYIGLKNIVLTVILCDNNYIREINRTYRKKNKSTDVISFSYRENPFPQAGDGPEQLGDIYLSLPKASENADSFGVSLMDETKRLLVHGILHLIGYDHERSKKDKKIMQDKEEEILQAI